MAKEHFPRIRKMDFSLVGTVEVPTYQGGRLDLVCADKYADPKAYRTIAAANSIVDCMACRPGIRPANEALQNELVLRGVGRSSAKKSADEIDEIRRLGDSDWLSYSDMSTGNITDVSPGMTLLVPTPDTAIPWYERYNTLAEVDEDEL